MYKEVYDKFLQNISNSVKGVIQDYGFKVVLDIMVTSGWIDQGHLSVWPVYGCDGYVKGLAQLCPGLPKRLYLWALYYVHRQLGHKLAGN